MLSSKGMKIERTDSACTGPGVRSSATCKLAIIPELGGDTDLRGGSAGLGKGANGGVAVNQIVSVNFQLARPYGAAGYYCRKR
jgi:hypothetical protein